MNRNEALIFMNICKEKCEQLNHHPNWTLSESKYGESLVSVILTTHDNNNNVSQKDFELASNLSYFYEERSSYYIYNRNIKNLVSMGFSVALAILFVSIFIHFYNKERNYNVRSKDFYLSKINH
jgi:pterin-4a-carbinolamine dehydratase